MRVLRPPVHEDGHRRDDRLALDVRDVEALDADGEALEVQHLAELLERGDAPRPRGLADGSVGLEREPRVLDRELDEAPLLAAERRAHDHARAAPLGQELRERARVVDRRGDEHLRRNARRGAVVLDDERLEDRLRVLARDVLEVEAVAVDHLPVAEREDLHGRLVAVDREPDHVDRPDVAPVGRLPLGEVPDREEPVPVARRLLEALVRRRLAHPLLELALDRLRVAREEADHALDDLAVVLLRDRPDARREAAVDVEVEARDAGVAARARPLAGPEAEDAVQDVERLAHLLRVRVRPEVDGAAAVPLAREHDARVLVRERHRDVRERLVVAQPDVEGRPVALDEVLLEVERLRLGARDDDLDVAIRSTSWAVPSRPSPRWK